MRYLISALLILITIIAMSNSALAVPGAGGLGWDNLKSFEEICPEGGMEDGEKLKVFSVVVGCFEDLVTGLAEKNIVEFSAYMQSAVSAALAIFVIIFGMKVASGMTGGDKLKGEFFVTMLKLAFVGWLVMNFGLLEMWGITMDVYNGLIEIVLVPSNMGACSSSGTGPDAVWETMDCLFTEIMGYSKQNGYGTSWTGVSLLSLIMGAKLFENIGGTFIFGIIASAIYSLIMSFVRLAFIYMLSIIGLILLYTVSPLIIPLMLFQKTKLMFERWYQTIISFILQVCIMFAFFSFISGIIYEMILGQGGLIEIYEQLKPKNEVSGMDAQGAMNQFAQVLTTGDEKTKELMYNFISLLLMAWLILSFIKFLDKLAHELAGSISAANLTNYTPSFAGQNFNMFGK